MSDLWDTWYGWRSSKSFLRKIAAAWIKFGVEFGITSAIPILLLLNVFPGQVNPVLENFSQVPNAKGAAWLALSFIVYNQFQCYLDEFHEPQENRNKNQQES